jgi:hypothetical protein
MAHDVTATGLTQIDYQVKNKPAWSQESAKDRPVSKVGVCPVEMPHT